MTQLTVYSMEGCAACVRAAQLLTRKGVPHQVVKIDEDFDAYEFIKKEGHRSFPQIYEGDKLFVAGGFAGLSQMGDEAFAKFK